MLKASGLCTIAVFLLISILCPISPAFPASGPHPWRIKVGAYFDQITLDENGTLTLTRRASEGYKGKTGTFSHVLPKPKVKPIFDKIVSQEFLGGDAKYLPREGSFE